MSLQQVNIHFYKGKGCSNHRGASPSTAWKTGFILRTSAKERGYEWDNEEREKIDTKHWINCEEKTWGITQSSHQGRDRCQKQLIKIHFAIHSEAESRQQSTDYRAEQFPVCEKDFNLVGLGQCFKCPGTHTFSCGTLQTVLQTQERGSWKDKCGSPICIFTLGSGLPLVTEATDGSFTGGTNSRIIPLVSSFKLTWLFHPSSLTNESDLFSSFETSSF